MRRLIDFLITKLDSPSDKCKRNYLNYTFLQFVNTIIGGEKGGSDDAIVFKLSHRLTLSIPLSMRVTAISGEESEDKIFC